METGGRHELNRPRGMRIGGALEKLVAARRALAEARRELWSLPDMRDQVAHISRLEDQVHDVAEQLIP